MILNDSATCNNFYFSAYVCTLLLQTIVVQCDYVLKQVQKLPVLYFTNNKHSFLQLPAFNHFIHSLFDTQYQKQVHLHLRAIIWRTSQNNTYDS